MPKEEKKRQRELKKEMDRTSNERTLLMASEGRGFILLHQRGFPRTSSVVPRDQTGELNGQLAAEPTSHIATCKAACHKPTPTAMALL
jgi:hypothetical protein